MSTERNYIQKFMSESAFQSKAKTEDEELKYAYTTRARSEDGGWEVASSIGELKKNWDKDYGTLNPKNILVLKNATSTSNAMVLVEEPNLGGTVIYPSIADAVNDLANLGWKEGDGLTEITQTELNELKSTTDLHRATELLEKTFVDAQDFGYFTELCEYVSGMKPSKDGVTPIKGSVPTEVDKSAKLSPDERAQHRLKVKAATAVFDNLVKDFYRFQQKKGIKPRPYLDKLLAPVKAPKDSDCAGIWLGPDCVGGFIGSRYKEFSYDGTYEGLMGSIDRLDKLGSSTGEKFYKPSQEVVSEVLDPEVLEFGARVLKASKALDALKQGL